MITSEKLGKKSGQSTAKIKIKIKKIAYEIIKVCVFIYIHIYILFQLWKLMGLGTAGVKNVSSVQEC